MDGSGAIVALREFYNSPMEATAWAMRGLLCAEPGHVLYGADYSNIEGRGIAWLAGEDWKLQAFRDYDAGTGPDLYKIAAGGILNIAPDKVSKTQRQLVGKPAELGLGYGGGVGAILTMMRNGAVVPWIVGRDSPPPKVTLGDIAATVKAGVTPLQWGDTLAKYADGAIETAEEIIAQRRLEAELLGDTDEPQDDDAELVDVAAEVAKRNRLGLAPDHWAALRCTVDNWRATNSNIRQFWKDLERAAFDALASPGQVFAAGRHVKFCKSGIYLIMRLPSGRCLHYPYARVATGQRWGKEVEQIVCMRRVNGRTGKWFFRPLYGGLLAENCLAGDTRILTDRGWTELQELRAADRVFDGVEFVAHGGLIAKGMQETIGIDGVRMTPDHQLLTEGGWRNASSCGGHFRATVRLPDSVGLCRFGRQEIVLERALRLWKNARRRVIRIATRARAIVRLQNGRDDRGVSPDARHDPPPGVRGMAKHDRPLQAADASSVAQLRRARHTRVRRVAIIRSVLARHGADVSAGLVAGPAEQRCGLFGRQLPVDNRESAGPKQAAERVLHDAARNVDSCRDGRAKRHRRDDAALPDRAGRQRFGVAAKTGCSEQVFDILNCGPRNQFVVLGGNGPFIAHNCTQAIARDILRDAMLRLHRAGYKIVLHVHDEIVCEMLKGRGSLEEMCTLMRQLEPWAQGLPVAVGGWQGRRFRK